MSLNNTSERYDYIFGNTARKVDNSYMDYQTTSPGKWNVPQQKPQTKTKREPRIKVEDRFDSKYTFMIILALGVMALAAFINIRQTSRMNALAHDIKVLKTEKADLQSRQVSIQSEIDKAVNLDHIRQYAEDKLDMVYPDHDNVIYYHQDSSDYFRQYESVDKR